MQIRSLAEFHINVSVDNKSEAVFTGIETQNSLSGLSQAIDYHESMHRHTCVRYSFAWFLLLLYFRTWSIKRDESTIGPRDRSSREYESVFRWCMRAFFVLHIPRICRRRQSFSWHHSSRIAIRVIRIFRKNPLVRRQRIK